MNVLLDPPESAKRAILIKMSWIGATLIVLGIFMGLIVEALG